MKIKSPVFMRFIAVFIGVQVSSLAPEQRARKVIFSVLFSSLLVTFARYLLLFPSFLAVGMECQKHTYGAKITRFFTNDFTNDFYSSGSG